MPQIKPSPQKPKNSVMGRGLTYKMLRLVVIQALFFAGVLVSLWVINPNWMFWHQVTEPAIEESFKDFKRHYGALNTLNLKLAQFRNSPIDPSLASINKITQELSQHIQAIKVIAPPAQQHFQLDFTVLVNFLFNYRAKVQALDPSALEFKDHLWDTQIYFSRIQSEFFYIVEEVDRFDNERAQSQLANAQDSLLIWGLTSLMIIVLGGVIAINYARQWKHQIANLLNQVYRLSADDYTSSVEIHTDDELGFLAKAIQEVVEKIRKSRS